jgi:hypothetical protein
VLNLNVESFMVEFNEGSLSNVGAPNKSAEAKLFDVEAVNARAFGDSQVKLVATDADGNEVQVALAPEQARSVRADLEALEDDSQVYE